MVDATIPDPEPDMIAQVGAMLKRVSSGLYTNDEIAACTTNYQKNDDDRAILVTSAILAVAAELRAIANELRTLNGGLAVSLED